MYFKKIKIQETGKLNKQLNILKKVFEKKVFYEEDVKRQINDCEGSINDIRRVIKWMRNRFGRKAFTPKIGQIISEHVNSLSHLHKAEKTTFKDKKGHDCKTVLSLT